jgi:hypothetical protein
MYKHRIFWTAALVSLFTAVLVASGHYGSSTRKYAADKTMHRIHAPEEAYSIWKSKNVRGRILILFDNYPHNMGYYSYNGEPRLLSSNVIEYAIFQNIIRRIYFIVPESQWTEFRTQKFIRPIREDTNVPKGLYLYNQSGIPIIAVPPSSFPAMKEKALVYINNRIFASDQALALLAQKNISSDIIITYESSAK